MEKAVAQRRIVLAAAAMLFFLGVGNVIVGSYRRSSYAAQVREDEQQIKASGTRHAHHSLPPSPTVNVDLETQHLTRLKARLAFFETVQMGGKLFLGLSVLLFLSGIFLMRGSAPRLADESSTEPRR